MKPKTIPRKSNAGRKPVADKKKSIVLYGREALRTEKVKELLEFTIDHLLVCIQNYSDGYKVIFSKGEVYQYFNREDGEIRVIAKSGLSYQFEYEEGRDYFTKLIN